MNKFDFVITTYQTLCLEFPKRKRIGPNGEELDAVTSDDSWDEAGQRTIRQVLQNDTFVLCRLFIRSKKGPFGANGVVSCDSR